MTAPTITGAMRERCRQLSLPGAALTHGYGCSAHDRGPLARGGWTYPMVRQLEAAGLIGWPGHPQKIGDVAQLTAAGTAAAAAATAANERRAKSALFRRAMLIDPETIP